MEYLIILSILNRFLPLNFYVHIDLKMKRIKSIKKSRKTKTIIRDQGNQKEKFLET